MRRDDFELPGQRGGARGGGAPVWISGVLLAAVIAMLALQVAGLSRRGERVGGLSSGQIEALALKLERQGLAAQASRAWSDYLETSGAGADKRARIWYRIGTIYQESEAYEEALDAFYRSESFAEIDELSPEISRRVAECLESMGNFAALSDELERRTALPGSDASGDEVLAEIGDRAITKSDLDAMIDSEVEVQLAQVAGGFSPEERRSQKESLIEGIRAQGGYGQWLERFIAEELLYRAAIEQELDEEREYRAVARSVERKLLAQRFVDRAVAGEVSVSEEEIKAYYETNRDRFEKDGAAAPFEEVRDRVYMALRSEKEMAVQRRLLDELKDRYDVVIHTPKPRSE